MVRINPAQLTLAFDCPEDWAAEALRQARLRVPSSKEPRMVWTSYTTCAGRAFFREFEIRLSRRVLKTQEQVHDTVLHEYAHLVVYERHGTSAKPHGPEWKELMRLLGGVPKATHDYPVERRSVSRNIIYRCNVCGFLLRRVRPFKRNRVYSHVGCGGVFAR
jgi:predicted SprT family Zn-dependent metalloprotease